MIHIAHVVYQHTADTRYMNKLQKLAKINQVLFEVQRKQMLADLASRQPQDLPRVHTLRSNRA